MSSKLRPIGAHVEVDGRAVFLIGRHKEMCRQLHENPSCEIGGFTGKGQWLRLTRRATGRERLPVDEPEAAGVDFDATR